MQYIWAREDVNNSNKGFSITYRVLWLVLMELWFTPSSWCCVGKCVPLISYPSLITLSITRGILNNSRKI